jgi:hypothetical protein
MIPDPGSEDATTAINGILDIPEHMGKANLMGPGQCLHDGELLGPLEIRALALGDGLEDPVAPVMVAGTRLARDEVYLHEPKGKAGMTFQQVDLFPPVTVGDNGMPPHGARETQPLTN